MQFTRRNWLGTVGGICGFGLANQLAAQGIGTTAASSNDGSAPALDLDSPIAFSEWQTSIWRFGVQISAGSGTCTDVIATFPLPRPWPEQKVKIVAQQASPFVTQQQTRDLNQLASQVAISAPRIPANNTLEVYISVELQRASMLAEPTVNTWFIPKKPDKDLKEFLTTSPYIDPRHAKIRRAINEILTEFSARSAESETGESSSETEQSPVTSEDHPLDGWKLVEKIYDWTRERVSYREGKIKTAVQALDDGHGDCEELTSLFVALCRAARVPARMVWVPGHCYPEFYLENAAGKGVWFPCQAAGTRMFGAMQEERPIIQKGDRFKVPEHKDVQRYVAEFVSARGTRKPQVSFISEKAS